MAEPGQKPLNFLTSVPKNGATNVSTRLERIKLIFDKNVTDDSVWQSNRQQIKMWKNGARVAIKVQRITTFEQRRNIYVKPAKGLSPNAKYTIAIYSDLTAKNGEKLDKSVVITFTTGKKVPTPIPVPQE